MRTYQQAPKEPVFWHPTAHEITVMAKMFRLLATLPSWKSRVDVAAFVVKYGIFELDNEDYQPLREACGLPERGEEPLT